MTDNTVTHTSANHTRDAYVENSSGSGALWFIVGGLVVAVAIGWFLVSGGGLQSAASGNVSVTVEGSESATAQSAPAPAESESAAPEASAGAEASVTTDGG